MIRAIICFPAEKENATEFLFLSLAHPETVHLGFVRRWQECQTRTQGGSSMPSKRTASHFQHHYAAALGLAMGSIAAFIEGCHKVLGAYAPIASAHSVHDVIAVLTEASDANLLG